MLYERNIGKLQDAYNDLYQGQQIEYSIYIAHV